MPLFSPIKNTITEEYNRPQSSAGISDVDFISVTTDRDYYDWDYINGEFFRFWLQIQDASAGYIDTNDDVRFWITLGSDTDDTQVMENIQPGSYSHSAVLTWLGLGSYGGDTQISYAGNGYWLFEVDSTIMDDYLDMSLAFDCYVEDTATGDVEELSWEDRFHYVRVIQYSVILTEPDPDQYITSSSFNIEWSHPQHYYDYFDDLDCFEVWLDSGTHYETTNLYYPFSSVSEGSHTAHVVGKTINNDYGIEQTVDFYVDTIPPDPPTLVYPSDGESINDITPYLEWNIVSDAVNYEVYVDDNSGFTSPSTYFTSNTYYTLSALSEDTYYWKVLSQDAATNWSPDSPHWNFTIDETPPIAPTLVSPSNGAIFNDSTPYLDWNSVSDAVNYEIYVDDNSGFTSPLTYFTSNTYYTLPTLSDDIYYWKVRSQDVATNWSPDSPHWNFTIDGIPPIAPILVSPSNDAIFNDATPYLNWNSVSDAVNYRVYVDDNVGFTSPSIFTTSNIYYTLPTLSDGIYYWKVCAQDAASNWGSNSTAWFFTVDTLGPDPPPSLVSPSDGAIFNDITPYLDWSSIADAVNYRVYVDDNVGFSSPLIYTTSNTYYTLPTLSDNVYYWKVCAQDAASNWGPNSTTWAFTVDTIGPVPPSLISPSNGITSNDDTTYLVWSTVSDAVNYRIYFDDNSGFSSPSIYTTSNTYYTLPTLSDGVYYWKVGAQDAASNWGSNSTYWSFTVDTIGPDPPSLNSPSNGAILNDNMPYLIWSTISDAVNYRIYLDDNEGFETPLIYTTSNTYYTLPTLSDSVYYWKVCAQDAASNWGSNSTSFVFTVDTVGPNPPSLIAPINNTSINDNTPDLDWGTVSDAVNYRIYLDDNSGFTSPLTYITTNTYYTLPTLGDGVYYWKVCSQDAATNWGSNSTIWCFTVDTIDYNPPVITVNTLNGNYYDAGPLIDVDFSDDKGLDNAYYKVDSYSPTGLDTTGWIPIFIDHSGTSFTSDFTMDNSVWISLTEGSHIVYFKVWDDSENINDGSLIWWQFHKDTNYPVISVNTFNDNYYDSAPLMDVDFSDIGGLDDAYYKVDSYTPTGVDTTGWIPIFTDHSGTNFTTDFTMDNSVWSSLVEGSHYVYFKAWDDLGNVNEGSLIWWQFYKDTNYPIITVNLVNGNNYDSAPLIDVDFSDIGGLEDAYYKVDSYTPTGLDTTGWIPIFTDHSGTNFATDFTMDNSVWISLTEGSHIVYFKTWDDSENINDGSIVSWQFFKDTNFPVIAVNILNGSYFDTAPSIDVDFSDIGGLDDAYYKVDSYSPIGLDTTGWIPIFMDHSSTSFISDFEMDDSIWNDLSEGSHVVYFKTWDDLSHINENVSLSWQFYKVNDPLNISIQIHDANYYNSAPIMNVDFFDTLGLDNAYYKVDSYIPTGQNTTGWAPIFMDYSGTSYSEDFVMDNSIWDGLKEGSHIVYFKAWDDEGILKDDIAFSWQFYKDTNCPTVILQNPIDNSVRNSGTKIVLDITDSLGLSEVLYKWDNAAGNSNYSSLNPPIIPMGDGLHELYIFAYDYAGNLKNVTFSFTCDDTNPTATFSGVANGMVLSETITITVSPSDANGIDFIIFYINDYLLANQSNDNTFPLDTRTYSDGAYDFKFEIYDIAGNCYEQQFSIEIKNKDTPPFIPGFNLELLFSISLFCIVITILKELKILNRKIAYKESST